MTDEAVSRRSARDLVGRLRSELRGEVDASTRRRAEYSSDASNYRVVPQVVAFPRDVDDLLAIVEVARTAGVPLTLRGGGTSVAGNAVGPGIVVDTSRHLTGIGPVDAEARTVRVEPGVVLTDLQRAAAAAGLRFGPDPSTANRATIGGMVGNNACGAHSVAFGRTADNVVSLDVVDGRGRRFLAASGSTPVVGLDAVVARSLATIRSELGRFSRQVSGYALEHLLPENGRDLAGALVGSEGTLVTLLGATVRLVPMVGATTLLVLGYADLASAADAAPSVLAHRPLALEAMDARLVDAVRGHGTRAALPELPRGAAWLLVEFEQASADPGTVVADVDCIDSVALTDAAAKAIWAARADGVGLAGRSPAGKPAWPGWEDAAVPPERLGAYLRAVAALQHQYGVEGLTYGHFGDGCVHARLDIPLADQRGPARLREFVTDAAGLVASFGGSLSGEHGDGRARSELLPLMYSAQALALFAAVKHELDPDNVLNPGVLVDPRPLDADLRLPSARSVRPVPGFAFAADNGLVVDAVHRCVGVGSCRADPAVRGGVMCPSFAATRDEKDSTRGRARVLQEVVNGSLVTGGWRSAELRDSLDLCLSCKACSRDCPAGVDMARYKSETLYRAYRRRLRPRSHYSLGWLPRWLRVARRSPRWTNLALGLRWSRRLVTAAAGIDSRRSLPPIADDPYVEADLDALLPHEAPTRRRVLIWADTFSATFSPEVLTAAETVLSRLGFEVAVSDTRACCGLTWVTTGQLDGARRRMARLVDAFAPFAEGEGRIVGLEPSCLATLRSDLVELLPGDPRASRVAAAVRSLAELLAEDAVAPKDGLPSLDGLSIVVQPHCHQHAVIGFEHDAALLRSLGASITVVPGCCGLAGSFGMERGHYDVSVAVAETNLLPALRSAPPDAIMLADGFSCRVQAGDLAGVTAIHLAELLAGLEE